MVVAVLLFEHPNFVVQQGARLGQLCGFQLRPQIRGNRQQFLWGRGDGAWSQR
jgi:hypothetical protein